MTTITPFFELDGRRYEINRTRFLLAEYDKLTEESKLSNEDRQNTLKAQAIIADVKLYAEKTKELWEIFTETFEDEDERKYLKAKALYETALDKLAKIEIESGCTERAQKAGLDVLEKIAILGLAEQYFDKDYNKAETLWLKFVEELGKSNVPEWLSAMAECLFGGEEEVEENSFLSQMRERAEAKSRKGKKKNK